jgi:WD40 repeat protein
MNIYDVRRRDGQHPIHQVQFSSFDPLSFPQSGSHEGEVTTASFSPDGLLLAITRSDDELQVFDSRFMGNSAEPMAQYLHWEDDCCVGGKWGIVDAVWVDGWCGRGFGVVTGGSDGEATSPTFPFPFSSACIYFHSVLGCVRFWDTHRSGEDMENGEVLARPNVDIGHFSVGDPHKGEKPLVV